MKNKNRPQDYWEEEHKHRKYFFPPYPNIDWSRAGTSDSFKKGHTIPYIWCDCEKQEVHIEGNCSCNYCQNNL